MNYKESDAKTCRDAATYGFEQPEIDFLTGLPGRNAFEKAMDRRLHPHATQISGYALIVDIDDFKAVNQGFGYDAGDALIVSLSHYLRETLPSYKVFRMNGDTFALICGDKTPGRLTEDMETVLKRCGYPWKIGSSMIFCTVSIAAAAYSSADKDVDKLCRNLNDALYQARKGGKNHFALYSEDVEHVANIVIKRRELEGLLWEAVEENFSGFTLHYQPIVCAVTGMVLGAEALLRFTTKYGQNIPPLSFIPLAEQNGLILPIGRYVLESAVRFCKTMIDAGYTGFWVNINLSIRQLENPCFAQTVLELLQKEEVPCGNIVLELTESMAAFSIERIRSACKKLLDAGIHLVLDDFGTGYSSLNMLRVMPFSGIKIDRTFISDMLVDECSDSFIKLIAQMKGMLGVTVYAEGVEEEGQLLRCKELGIDFIQGFIYHKAMPGHELIQMMRAPNGGC